MILIKLVEKGLVVGGPLITTTTKNGRKRVEFSGGLHRLYTQTGHRKPQESFGYYNDIASGRAVSFHTEERSPPCTKEELDLFLSSARTLFLATCLEVLCSNIDEGLPMQEKAGVLTKRLKEQYSGMGEVSFATD